MRAMSSIAWWVAPPGVVMPGKINYRRADDLRMEITQTIAASDEVTPNVLAAPPSAQICKLCTNFRPALGESVPQPKPGNGGQDFVVVVRGIIGENGMVREAVVQKSERPDLNSEALSVIGKWLFKPALCNGRPASTEASFTLHFQGR